MENSSVIYLTFATFFIFFKISAFPVKIKFKFIFLLSFVQSECNVEWGKMELVYGAYGYGMFCCHLVSDSCPVLYKLQTWTSYLSQIVWIVI